MRVWELIVELQKQSPLKEVYFGTETEWIPVCYVIATEVVDSETSEEENFIALLGEE